MVDADHSCLMQGSSKFFYFAKATDELIQSLSVQYIHLLSLLDHQSLFLKAHDYI